MNKSQLRSKEARVGDHDGQMGCNASALAQVAHPTAGPAGMVARESGQANASAERAVQTPAPAPAPAEPGTTHTNTHTHKHTHTHTHEKSLLQMK